MDDYEMTSLLNMTPEEFDHELRIAVEAVYYHGSYTLLEPLVEELLAQLRERNAAMEIVEHWKFSPAADWSAETQSFAAGVLLLAMQAARRGKS
jgi:uncharacterized protein YjaZ